MDEKCRQALATGSERLAAWSDLLDRINVFPVADGDTGRNLVISLLPLKDLRFDREELINSLMLAARGNSGNIAAQFFNGLITEYDPADLAGGVRKGRELAWGAVADPKPGTMLSLFDALDEGMAETERIYDSSRLDGLIDRLERAVLSTREQLPSLKQAGVVDAGALGMFIFWDGFFNSLHGRPEGFRPIAERFRGAIEIGDDFKSSNEEGYCVDAVIRAGDARELLEDLAAMGDSLVTITHGDLIKVHLHADDVDEVRKKLEARADLLRFFADDLCEQTKAFQRAGLRQAIHVMTDAAGSVTRTDAQELGMTVLDSYVNIGSQSIPETHVRPADLYAAMQAGVGVSTSQASVFERHQHYCKALGLYERVLYVCVGSVFTGNHQVVVDWKKDNDPDDRLTVVDSQAASGRLGLMALAAARKTLDTDSADAVIELVRRAVDTCREYIFLDQLKWLAAGGRLSRTSAFFGDLLHMKPVVSPTAEGAKKVAVVRNRKAQVEFAIERLDEAHARDGPGVVMLEYTDNRDWVDGEVGPVLAERFGESELLLQPVSLTSGAHMGPGTWAVAYLPRMGEG